MTNNLRVNRDVMGKLMVEAGLADTKAAGIALVDKFFDVLRTQIIAGNEVAIPDFGKFGLYTRQNGTMKPKFTPFQAFKEDVASLPT